MFYHFKWKNPSYLQIIIIILRIILIQYYFLKHLIYIYSSILLSLFS